MKGRRIWKLAAALCVTISLLLLPGAVMAADTVETWDVGATDVDFYLGYDGIGLRRPDRTVFGDMMLGYGILDRFSAYLGMTLQGTDAFTDGTASLYLGIYGTPVDTDHFDLDLFLDVSTGGDGLKEFQVSPSLEMNFDLDPDLRTWGMYLRVGFPVYGRTVFPPGKPNTPEHEVAFHIETTAGTYWTVAEGHQLLLEYDMGLHPLPSDEVYGVNVGGVALGYNVCVVEDCALELINQVYFDIPQAGENFSVGIMMGFIATLPSVNRHLPASPSFSAGCFENK
ncbi:MAG: hypothetical protein GXP54_06690 [Deltaproteobacteria bacterium]|nr:hypothetical protein [Deltaproteobacteria bacterium]